MRDVTLQLPDAMVLAALRLARCRDETLGHVIRDALAAEIRRSGRNARTPNRAEEQLLAPLRALLAVDFGEARSWSDLLSRLQSKGYALREAGGGLALHSHPDGARMCKASDLGYAYSALMRRFQAPFPNHSHRHLVARYLGEKPTNDDFEVIERE